MTDIEKTKAQLIAESADLRRRVAELEKVEAEHQKTEVVVREAREYAERIVDTVREPLVTLDDDLRVISANRSFYQIFKDAGGDFYKIDTALFAPAKITVKNVKTGNIFTAGEINVEILKQSLALMENLGTG